MTLGAMIPELNEVDVGDAVVEIYVNRNEGHMVSFPSENGVVVAGVVVAAVAVSMPILTSLGCLVPSCQDQNHETENPSFLVDSFCIDKDLTMTSAAWDVAAG